MTIFADYHHSALAESLRLLFETRLDCELYFPEGMEWYDEGYWKIGDPYGKGARNTAQQFLNKGVPSDGTAIISPHRTITLQEFKDTKFDILIASYRDHIPVYRELISKYQPQAKLVFQVGNMWDVPWDDVDNVLASIKPMRHPLTKNVCFYHQEFSYPEYTPPPAEGLAASFVNALNINSIFVKDWLDFQEIEKRLTNYSLYSFGGGCRDGSLDMTEVPDRMQECDFIIQLKTGGDGYGHVVHTAAAMGRPIIYRSSQYQGTLAEDLFIDSVTAFDLDKWGTEALTAVINGFTKEDWLPISKSMKDRFSELVDFNQDAAKISSFLDRLQ